MQTTFVIIKPDAHERKLVGEIIKRFEQRGLYISRIESRRKNYEWCEQHYHQLATGTDKDRSIFRPLALSMAKRPLIGIVLEGPQAPLVVKRMVGATDSVEADPGTIRGDFGTRPVRNNLVHAADSQLVAKREAAQFFNPATDCWPNEIPTN